MLTALILICSLATTPDVRDCNKSNAVDVLNAHVEASNPATCFMLGQAALAGTEIGRNLPPDEKVKVVCVKSFPSAP